MNIQVKCKLRSDCVYEYTMKGNADICVILDVLV